MLVELIFPAFSLGLLGSWHCLGMCGPLMFSLSLQGGGVKKILTSLYYHTMRIISYGVLGLLGGLLSSGIISQFGEQVGGPGTGFIIIQRILSILSGTVLIVWGILYSRKYRNKKSVSKLISPIDTIGNIIGNKIDMVIHRVVILSKYLRKDNLIHLGILGWLHGWLPCGLVYAAVTASLGYVGYGRVDLSMMFMFFFGLGTFPSMVLALLGFSKLTTRMRLRLQTAIPVSLFFLGFFFILRGLDLGIPFLSPSLEKISMPH